LPGRPTYYDVTRDHTLIAVGKYLELAGRRPRWAGRIEALAAEKPACSRTGI